MEERKNIEVKREEKTDSGMVGSTFIKYAAYLIILWYLMVLNLLCFPNV